MKKNAVFLFLIILGIMVPFACSQDYYPGSENPTGIQPLPATQNPTTANSGMIPPTQTSAPSPTLTLVPQTSTPLVDNSSLLAILGEASPGPWWYGIPVFSQDSNTIFLVTDQGVRQWDILSHKQLSDFHMPYANCIFENAAANSDGKSFAVSLFCDDTGHLVIWDLQSGDIIQDWEQAWATLSTREGEDYIHPASGVTFMPDFTKVVFANGHTMEIRDVRLPDAQPTILNLGEEMIANYISVSQDGKTIYVLMDFEYINSFGNLVQKYAVQVWDLGTKSIQREMDFPFITEWTMLPYRDERITLYGKHLIHINHYQEFLSLHDLDTGEVRQLPYRRGDVEISFNNDLIAYVIADDDLMSSDSLIIELWNVNSAQRIQTIDFCDFSAFYQSNCRRLPHDITFSPDNTLLAIVKEERIFLWKVSGEAVEP